MRRLQVPVAGAYEDLYCQAAAEISDGAPPWLRNQREAAFSQFRESGFPTRNIEAWKYTDITELAERSYAFASTSALDPQLLNHIPLYHDDEYRLVFVDRLFNRELSSPKPEGGVAVTRLPDAAGIPSLKGALTRSISDPAGPFARLNEALWRDGVVVCIAGKRKIERRLHLFFLHSGTVPDTMIAPRCAIAVGGLSEVRLSVTHASLQGGSAFNNAVMDLDLGEGAQVEMCHTQALSPDTCHVATSRITQRQDSRLHLLDFGVGGQLSRHEIQVALAGSGSEVVLDGIGAVRGKQVMDSHTVIEHLRPHCRSRQLYKSVLDDKAVTVFNGIVQVCAGAAGTDGEQMNRSLLLSRDAKANTKPELEIANDDVRCTHGATIGQLSEQELFYLESRGIAPAAAREMLARGFLEEVLYRLDDRRRHADLHALLDRYFETAGHIEEQS